MNLNKEQRNTECIAAFWELLRCGLSGDCPDTALFPISDDEVWKRIGRIAEVQAVTAICYQAVQRLPKDQQPSWKLLLEWHMRTHYIVLMNERLRRVWFELNRRLREAHIRSVLLKGIGVASYYPTAQYRVMGDLDVYIHEDFDRVVRTIESWGIPIIYGRWHHKFYYEGVEVELHHTYWGQDRAADTDCFEDVEEPEGTYTVLRPLLNARMLTVHTVHHLLEGGIGVRHLCDWAMFLLHHRGLLDWKDMDRIFGQIRSERFIHAFSLLAEERLGMRLDLPVTWTAEVEKDRNLLEQDMLVYGNFGRGKPEVSIDEFRHLSNWAKAEVVYGRVTRAARFHRLCPAFVRGYIGSQLAYVFNSIVSGRSLRMCQTGK